MTLLKKRLSKDMSPTGAKKVRVSYYSPSSASSADAMMPLYSADAARLEILERMRFEELIEARAASSEFKLARRGSATAAMMMSTSGRAAIRSTSPPSSRLRAAAPFSSNVGGSSVVTPTNLSPDRSPLDAAPTRSIPSPRALPSLPFERRQRRSPEPAANPAASMTPLDLLCSVSTHVAARSEAASRSASPEEYQTREMPKALGRAEGRQVSVSPDAIRQAYRYQPASSPHSVKETYQVGSSPQEYQAATPYVVKRSYQAESPESEPSYAGERHPSTGLRHGRGIMAYPNGCRYVGEFRDDRRSGFGKCWYPDNLGVYTGMWEDGKKSGKGTMEYANGDVYEGEWSDDRPHGVGTLRMKESRESFTGEFRNQKKHGRGVYEHANGDVYEGVWENDVRHGEGVVTYASGEVFGRVYCRGRLL